MRKCLATILLTGLLSALAGCQTGTDLWAGPYVVDANETSAKILWITSPGTAPTSLVMERGAAIQMRTESISKQKQIIHEATVTGLDPGKAYHYMVVFHPGNKLTGDQWGRFETEPLLGSTAPLRFGVMGDTRSYPWRCHEVTSALSANGPLAFVVTSGDMVADGTVWPLWKREYFDPAEDMLRQTTLIAAMGNHEQDGAMAQKILAMPKSYYSVDYGNVHYVILNSEIAGGKPAPPEMLAWLEKDLTQSKAEWKLVSYHRPTFDIITHRTTWGQDDVLPILERCGVDMVLNGHTHNYQRFRPIGEPGKKPTIFVVSAGGGAPNYPVNPGPILEKAYSGLHYCLFNVSGNTLDMTVKYPSGLILDHLTLIKSPDGMYQKEVMDRAVTTEFARESQFLLTGFYARSAKPPEPGKLFTMQVSPYQYPEGTVVEVCSAAPVEPKPGELYGDQWIVPPQTLTGFVGKVGVNEDKLPGPKLPRLTFQAYAPIDWRMKGNGFSPQIRVALKVTFRGQTYTNHSTGVYFYSLNLKSWAQQLAPAGLVATPEK